MRLKVLTLFCVALFCVGCAKYASLNYSDTRSLMMSLTQLDDDTICNKSVDESGIDWNKNYSHYVLEAKRRKLSCGIPLLNNEKLTSISDYDICEKSTRMKGDGSYAWRTDPNSIYVKEAHLRNLDCNVDGFSYSPYNYTKNNNTIELTPSKVHLNLEKSVTSSVDIAIIIGNSNYRRNGQDIPNVLPAKNDAISFKKFAQEQLGINSKNIIYIDDATTSQLERVFGNYRSHKGNAYNWVRPGKSKLYVYYAGHGAPGEDGTAYLVPSDASANSIDINGYPISTLYANLSKIPSLSTTVILESCFSGNSPSGSVINNASPVYQKANDISIPSNLTVITAGSMNQLASWTPDKKHGLFTYHYIKGMSGDADGPDYGNQDGDVSMPELQAYLDDNVTYYARRHYGRDQNVQISLAE